MLEKDTWQNLPDFPLNVVPMILSNQLVPFTLKHSPSRDSIPRDYDFFFSSTLAVPDSDQTIQFQSSFQKPTPFLNSYI